MDKLFIRSKIIEVSSLFPKVQTLEDLVVSVYQEGYKVGSGELLRKIEGIKIYPEPTEVIKNTFDSIVFLARKEHTENVLQIEKLNVK